MPTKYINKNQEWITDALLSNAHQIVLQLERAKLLVHEKLLGLFLVPYAKLNIVEEWKAKAANKYLSYQLVMFIVVYNEKKILRSKILGRRNRSNF